MCVITRVVSVGEADVTTEADLDSDGVFATHWRPDGELPEAFFLEVMAQTIGIWSHVHDDLTVVPLVLRAIPPMKDGAKRSFS